MAAHEAEMRFLAMLDDEGPAFVPTAKLTSGVVTVELDLSGAIDVEAERKRLTKDLAAATKEFQQATAKLGNSAFTQKAPAAVVDKIRGRLSAAEADVARLEAALAALPSH